MFKKGEKKIKERKENTSEEMGQAELNIGLGCWWVQHLLCWEKTMSSWKATTPASTASRRPIHEPGPHFSLLFFFFFFLPEGTPYEDMGEMML